jgi:glycosyltransferase involved in cell wall biosynthesis
MALQLAEALSERGMAPHIHVSALDSHFPLPLLPAACVLHVSDTAHYMPERLDEQSNLDQLKRYEEHYQYSLRAFAESADSVRSRFNIGIDGRGALAARFRKIAYGEPYVLFSLELPTEEPRTPLAKLAHHAEREALRDASAVIIQDKDRARCFFQYYGASCSPVFLLPNSPPDTPAPLRVSDEMNFFRRKFNLDKDRFPFVVAQVGMASYDVYAKQVAAATRGIPGFAFVFHERSRRDADDPEIAHMRMSNEDSLFFSLDPVPYDQLAQVYSSVDIGIVYYRPYHQNNAEIAFASGKLAFLLRHGIPVVMNDIPSLAQLNRDYDIGCLVQDPGDSDQLATALNKIAHAYEHYSRNARRCFLEVFEFRNRAGPLLEFLEHLR